MLQPFLLALVLSLSAVAHAAESQPLSAADTSRARELELRRIADVDNLGLLTEAATLIRNNQAQQAWEALMAREDLAGTGVYDFLVGQAALATYRLAEGVMALERFVLNYPDDFTGHFELGVAYFRLGEDDRAADELTSALSLLNAAPTGADTKRTGDAIERYLDAIKARQMSQRRSLRAWVGIGGGFDSNPKASAQPGAINLGGFTVQLLTPVQSSYFESAHAGMLGTYPLLPQVYAFGLAQIDRRQYTSSAVSGANLQTVSIQAGIARNLSHGALKFSLANSYSAIDGEAYRSLPIAMVELSHVINPDNSLSLNYQRGKSHYTAANGQYNANAVRDKLDGKVYAVGLSWQRALKWPLNSALSLGFNKSVEDVDAPSSQSYAKDNQSIAAHLTSRVADWTLSLAVVRSSSDYKVADSVIDPSKARLDHTDSYTVLASYLLNIRSTVSFEANVANNESNIPLFSYQRQGLEIKYRYEWK